MCTHKYLVAGHTPTNLTVWRALSALYSEYRIALNFRGSLISWISRIFNHLRKYFNKNFRHAACGVCAQWVREIISMKSSKIAIRKNLDPRKFSAVWRALSALYSEYVETRMYEGQFLLLIVHSKMLVSCLARVGLLVRNGLVNKVKFLVLIPQKW